MFLSGSKLFNPLKADRSINVPSVAFNGVKEWPVPGTRTGPLPCRTAAARATSSLGATISFGLQTTPPDQFAHLPPTIFMSAEVLRYQCAATSNVGEFWGTLLQVMIHAFLEVRPFEAWRHLSVCRHERLAKVLEIGFPHLCLHHRHGPRRNCLCEQPSVSQDVLRERLGREHFVHQTHFPRLARRNSRRREQKIECMCRTTQPRQQPGNPMFGDQAALGECRRQNRFI